MAMSKATEETLGSGRRTSANGTVPQAGTLEYNNSSYNDGNDGSGTQSRTAVVGMDSKRRSGEARDNASLSLDGRTRYPRRFG